MKISNSQSKFLEFLRMKEQTSQSFTIKEVLSATGWKASTFKTYLNKGQLSDFISYVDGNHLKATNTSGLDEIK